jgi:CxxC motif-containing protein
MTREMICINCPMGCNLTVQGDLENLTITGQTCPLGEKYAREEITNPTRNIAASIRVRDGTMPMLSVKTDKPVPKDKIQEITGILRLISVQAPVEMGEIIVQNICGTGVDIVATRSVPATESL